MTNWFLYKNRKNIPKICNQRFGMLTVISVYGQDSSKNYYWNCKCDCGNMTVVRTSHLKTTKSCGCLLRSLMTTHGKTKTKEHRSWIAMKRRCDTKTHDAYKYYGGRGISVCDRWINSFENFLEDMGIAPSPNHSIDRINPDGNYEPSNCKWSTRLEQANNKRKSKQIEL